VFCITTCVLILLLHNLQLSSELSKFLLLLCLLQFNLLPEFFKLFLQICELIISNPDLNFYKVLMIL